MRKWIWQTYCTTLVYVHPPRLLWMWYTILVTACHEHVRNHGTNSTKLPLKMTCFVMLMAPKNACSNKRSSSPQYCPCPMGMIGLKTSENSTWPAPRTAFEAMYLLNMFSHFLYTKETHWKAAKRILPVHQGYFAFRDTLHEIKTSATAPTLW